MAQKKSHEVESWLKRPDRETVLVLVYGPDRGLVAERARKFADSTGLPLDDPFSVVKLDAASLERDAGRLLDEANAVAMFAAKRLLWIRGAGADKRLADEVKLLLASPPIDTLILLEAGDLKKGAALRSVVEGAAKAMALPCYPEEGRDLDRLIDEELGMAQLAITPDARQLLRSSLGGDRLASRSELRKLALYMLGADRSIAVADIQASISDVSQGSEEDVVSAMLTGRLADVDEALTRTLATPGKINQLLSAGIRRLQALQTIRAAIDAGASVSAAVGSVRPPLFFSQRATMEQAAATWAAARIQRALSRLQGLVLATRQRPDLAAALLRQAFLGLTAEAGGPRRRS